MVVRLEIDSITTTPYILQKIPVTLVKILFGVMEAVTGQKNPKKYQGVDLLEKLFNKSCSLKYGFHKKLFIMNSTLVSCPFPSSLLGGCNSKPTQK